MTSRSFSRQQWALQRLLQEEAPTKRQLGAGHHSGAGPELGVLYLKYLQIFRRLEDLYEQLVQPQRRRAVRMVLDGLMGRILELRTQMVSLQLSEFHYFDDLLLDLKMTPKDLEIPVPRYFLREKNQLQKKFAHVLEAQQTKHTASCVPAMSLEEAVLLLQVSERARQGRIRAQYMKELVQSERGVLRNTWKPPKLTPHQAAVTVQKVWRGYRQRKQTVRHRTEEMRFLGMIPAEPPGPGPACLRARRASPSLSLIQDQEEEEYRRAHLRLKRSLLDVEGTEIRETLQDQIRQWFLECRGVTGKFPEFPDGEDGGSASLFSQKTPEQVSVELAAREEERQKRKERKKEREKEKTGNMKKKKKTKAKTEDDSSQSRFLPDVVKGDQIFTDVWRCRDDRQQSVDLQLLREETRQEVEQEVRLQVDDLMRAELKNLKLVVDKTKEKKTKTGNRKKKKKTKKKKKRDLTADRSLQSLCEELILEGFLIQPMNIKLSDYIGEFSFLASTLRQLNVEPTPSLSDIRQLVALYAVLPLGSPAVWEKFPVVNTLLLAGPSGVGKKMLVHAVCSETGAHLFHLNPAHRSPDHLSPAHLLHRIFKVAGELQPSVIWIEDAEKTFCKKTPKSDRKCNPLRFRKELLKSLRSLTRQDRVLVIGTTRRPFDANVKPFCNVFKKILLIPKPDYSSRLALWRALLRAEGAEPAASLDLSSLAKITDGFTAGHILQAVRSVLRRRRLQTLGVRPLAAAEFIRPLARMEPVYSAQEHAFKVWLCKTPLGRRKARAAKTTTEEEGGGKEGKKKKKKMKKKKKI
ncbi:dynein regulatory complex protein 11-like [Sander vitreus]